MWYPLEFNLVISLYMCTLTLVVALSSVDTPLRVMPAGLSTQAVT